MTGSGQADREQGAFEAVARLARAAASVPVDERTAAVTRARFLDRLAARGRGRVTLLLGFALVAAGGGAGLLLVAARPAPSLPGVAGVPAGSTDVPLLQGGTLVRFRDGSELELEPDGRGRLAELVPAGGRVVLEEGALRVKVVPRPGARWTIEAGPFRVQVKGTAFRVRWQEVEGRFELQMTEGVVVVSGPRLDRRLQAGQRLAASRDGELLELVPAPRVAAAPVPARPRRSDPRRQAAIARAEPEPSWVELLGRGALAELLERAEAEGIAHALERRDLEDLGALATAARLQQRADLARRAFRAQRVRFPASDAAHEAAFHLGRLADDADHDAAAAVAWYDQYLDEAPSGTFVAEALARKLDALERLTDPALRPAARATARAYLTRFPEGPARDQARRILGQP
jgi:hypothetical protein